MIVVMGRPHLPYDLERPIFPLESAQPKKFAPYVDTTRAQEGWARWAIPKLVSTPLTHSSTIYLSTNYIIISLLSNLISYLSYCSSIEN